MVVTVGIALGVTLLPALLRREYGYSMDEGLLLWITVAMILHIAGALGLYGQYQWYDEVTHAVSATLIAGVGYASFRALELHYDDIDVTSEFRAVFSVVFVLAAGILWKVLEFALGGLVTVYGIDDIVTDLIFNAVGAVVVAVWGTEYVHNLVGFSAIGCEQPNLIDRTSTRLVGYSLFLQQIRHIATKDFNKALSVNARFVGGFFGLGNTHFQSDRAPTQSTLRATTATSVMGTYTAFNAEYVYDEADELKSPFISDPLFDPETHVTKDGTGSIEHALADICKILCEQLGVRAFIATDIGIPTKRDVEEKDLDEPGMKLLDQSVEFAAVVP